nr:putative peptide/nitrate transporter [Ipomoea batatas]GMC81904.1 putative peptide/nitrate transporter [Ipomoea batatas]GMC85977.1 putative peptide/nitrate transporter [Ipomoea batatas]GMC88556.1 putative peptide/nitrate transporter [Ipomoea batatas]
MGSSTSCNIRHSSSGNLQHAFWPKYKFLDGNYYKVYSRKFVWNTRSNEGICCRNLP